MVTAVSHQTLAKFVLRRRADLDMSQDDVQAADGPSKPTLTKIESGRGPISRTTLKKLDKALEWVPGSARAALYEDAAPIPLPPSGDVASSALGREAAFGPIEDANRWGPHEELIALTRALVLLEKVTVARSARREDTSALQPLLDGLNRAVAEANRRIGRATLDDLQ